jgi:hypothetical protein
MVTKPTGGSKGRPPKPFLQDPDRHLIAAAKHFQRSMANNRRGCSEREVYSLAICLLRGVVHRRIRYASGDEVKIKFEVEGPDGYATHDSKISTLRKKSERWEQSLTEDERNWFEVMARIFELGTRATKDATLADELMGLASSIGESEWVAKWICPSIGCLVDEVRPGA